MAAARWPVAPGCRTRGSIALTTLILSGAILGAVVGAEAAGGTSVRNAQVALERSGEDPGPIDGVMGPRTKAAIERYQRAQGLEVTGAIDAQTRARLGAASPDSARVRAVQEALKGAGQDPGPVDGTMGPLTRAALRRYAAAPAPGEVDAQRAVIDEFLRTDSIESP